jgi:hypothetical protein
VLFDPVRRRVFTLGNAEATAWCLLSDLGDTGTTADALARLTGRPVPEARQWLEAALSLWSAAGLLTPQTPATPPIAALREAPSLRYRLLDVTVEVTFPTGAADGADLLSNFATDRPADVTVSLIEDGGGCVVVVDGQVAERAPRALQAIPLLKLVLVRLALSRASGTAAMHAACVAHRGRGVLLPAPAGAGKSTLAAATALSPGWELVADDTVVLDRSDALRPLPFAICLKPGSWTPLAALTADIDALAVYERPDGLLARYLPAPIPATKPCGLTAVVLPQWKPGAKPLLEPITPQTSFCAVMQQTYPLHAPLDATVVERLARLLEPTPCFAMTYDRLTDGVAMLREASAA